MAEKFVNERLVCTTNAQTIYTTPGVSGGTQRTILTLLQAANVGPSTDIVSVSWFDASNDNAETRLGKDIPIPPGASINLIGGKFALEAADYIRLIANNNTSIEITLSGLEIT